jgi:hypothetical protein
MCNERSGINWQDIDEMTRSGVNWMDMDVMSNGDQLGRS